MSKSGETAATAKNCMGVREEAEKCRKGKRERERERERERGR